MDVRLARDKDLPSLARLLWMHSSPDEQETQSAGAFAADLASWWDEHQKSHYCFVAQVGEPEVIGAAWLALLPRVPRPGNLKRLSADLQSVFVVPDHRGNGIGSLLIKTALEFSEGKHVKVTTVQSGRRALPVYRRLGFASSPQLLQRAVE